MKVGDLVKICGAFSRKNPNDTGIIISIEKWVDKGAPDRNFGVDVKVLWSNGEIGDYDEPELTLVINKKINTYLYSHI